MTAIRSWISMILKWCFLINLLHCSSSRFRALKLLSLMKLQLIELLRAIWVTVSCRVGNHNIPSGHTESIVSKYEAFTFRTRTMILGKVYILWGQIFNVILLRHLNAARKVMRHPHHLIELTNISNMQHMLKRSKSKLLLGWLEILFFEMRLEVLTEWQRFEIGTWPGVTWHA